MIEKRNIFLIGPIGSGKSSIGRKLAKYLYMDFFDSNEEIEKQTGVNIEWIIDLEGEEKFKHREEKIIYNITKKNGIILAVGTDAILSKNTRNRLSIRGIIIYLKSNIEKQLIYIKENKKKIIFNKLINQKKILKEKEKKTKPIYKEIADITINTHQKNIQNIIKQIINIL